MISFDLSLSLDLSLALSLNGFLLYFAVEDTDIRSADLLLSQEFVKRSIKKFSLPLTESEKSSAKFCPKYLNIIDPLRENNNLGRSVSKG